MLETISIELNSYYLTDGNWGSWGTFDECTMTCGDSGVRTRKRECNDPAPLNGGQVCVGSESEVAKCSLMPCRPG